MERTISIRGEGRLAVRPDTAEVTFVVASREREYAKVMAEQERMRSALSATIEKHGFAAEDIKTVSFGVNAMYDSVCVDNEYRSVFSGYRAEHRMLVRFPLDKERLAAVLTAVSDCVAEPELNIRFTVDDPDAAAEELLALAAADALKKANALAAAAGCRLGELVRIDTGGGAPSFVSPTNYDCSMKMARIEAAGFEPMDAEASESALFVWELI